jgi:hypothetical protein
LYDKQRRVVAKRAAVEQQFVDGSRGAAGGVTDERRKKGAQFELGSDRIVRELRHSVGIQREHHVARDGNDMRRQFERIGNAERQTARRK